jgi:hypothetical protein
VEPRRLTALWAFTACYRDSFTFYLLSFHPQFWLLITSYPVNSPSFSLSASCFLLLLPQSLSYSPIHTSFYLHLHMFCCFIYFSQLSPLYFLIFSSSTFANFLLTFQSFPLFQIQVLSIYLFRLPSNHILRPVVESDGCTQA